MRPLRALLRALMARTRFEREMREELRLHIERRAEDLSATGLPSDEARRQACVEFGAVERYKEQCRDASGFAPLRPLHGIPGDFKLATRRLIATPLFTIFAVLSLAVGLGVTTAAYSVVAAIFFTSSGIADEDRVVNVVTAWGRSARVNGGISQADVEDLRKVQAFTSVSAYALMTSAVTTPSGTDLMRGEAVDDRYFATLGVQPMLGRAIDARDVAQVHRVVVISHALWSRRFGADPALLGQSIRIAGEPFEVIGITPESFNGFGGAFNGTRLWIPVSADPRLAAARQAGNERDRPRFVVVARLAPGVDIGVATTELTALGAGIDAVRPSLVQAPGPRERAWSARGIGDRDGDVVLRRFGIAFIALVSLVLVVACTNLANLVLARGIARQPEFAIRRAIGASRWRIVREQCAESLLLALLGGAAATGVFIALSALLDVQIPLADKFFLSFVPTLDGPAVAIAVGALLVSLLVFGLEPAFQLTRDRDLRPEMGTSSGTVGAPKARRQRALVRWQVAISTGFFILAALCVRYTFAEARHDSGVDLDRLSLASMNFWRQQWNDERASQAVGRLLGELKKDPLVESAAISTGVPFGSSNTQSFSFSTVDKPITERGTFWSGPGIAATPHLFRTLGVPIVRGRAFDDRDHAGAPPVVVVSEQTAMLLFGTADVVGREMLLKPRQPVQQKRSVAGKLALSVTPQQAMNTDVRTATIVGVAADTDIGSLFSRIGVVVYMPLEQRVGALTFAIALVRSNSSPSVAVRSLREAVVRTDYDLAIESSGTGLGVLGGPTPFLRAGTAFALSLGAITLLLSMVGLYGVQSHGVERRTREIGVRLSFGATAAQIRTMVLKDGYRPVLQGVAIGIFLGFTGRGLVRAFLWDNIELVDPWMLFAVPLPMVLAAFLACWWPARRASRVDPNVALRHL